MYVPDPPLDVVQRGMRSRIAAFKQALQFRKRREIFLTACGAFRPNESRKIENYNIAIKCFHSYRVGPYRFKITQARNFSQQIDFRRQFAA
jgi:hypothetical protein